MKRTSAAPLLWAALTGVALQGCTPTLPAPSVTGTSPDWAYNGEATEVRIDGQGFFPAVAVDLTRQEPSVDRQFLVELVGDEETLALEGVELRSTSEITGFVPEGHLPGTYDLRVTTPSGQEATLAEAFAITETRADHLALVWDLGPYEVGETVVVGVQVQDPNDDVVPVPMTVEVHFSSSLESSGLEIRDADLLDFVLLQDGLRGRLPATGQGFVAFSSSLPELLEIVATPADTASFVDPSEAGFASFEAGTVAGIELQVPDQLEARAGEPFDVIITPVDELGNALHGERVVLALTDESCFGQVQPATVELTGPASIPVTFFRSCASTRLVVQGDADGVTESFSVAAASVSGLRLQLDPADPVTTVTAGEAELSVLVEAVDPYGNHVAGYGEPLEWNDDAGGLATLEDIGLADCGAWALGTRRCTLTLERASDGATVSAFDQRGNSGTLPDPIAVLAADPAEVRVTLTETEHVAGQSFDLLVDVLDPFGNVADIDPLGTDLLAIDDGFGTTICSWEGQQSGGEHLLTCTSTTADLVQYEVSLPAFGLSGFSDEVEVVNGPLALAVLSAPSSVTAGQAFSASLATYDAWNNPYESGSRAVQLADDSGAVARTLTLDAVGAWSGSSLQITLAGSRTLTLSQNNLVVGSWSLTVDPAALAALLVTPERSWAWVSEGRLVTVAGIDIHSNVVPSYQGPVTLSSEDSLFVSRELSSFSSGQATTSLVWDDVGLSDRVRAVGSGGEAGVSAPIDVVQDCTGGPTADLVLDDDGLACLVSGSASLSADLSGSVEGDEAIVMYHLVDGGGGGERSTSSAFTLESDSVGAWRVEALVVDAEACASEMVDTLWVNEVGEPAGPLAVSVASPSRTAGGTAITADTTVTVTATDCAGDIPTATALHVRTDLGSLSGVTTASDGLTSGLASGVASFTWSGQALGFDGVAVVYAGTLDGASFGSAQVSVTGDSTRPEVTWVDPSGTTDELFEQVAIGFNEPLLGANNASLVSLEGPEGEVDFSYQQLDDTVILQLLEVQDADAGEWTLTISSELRDDSGNKLDGQWIGSTSTFAWSFGDVAEDGVELSSCALDTDTLTPDGLDGAGDEADDVSISAIANATPGWWRVTVLDSEGVTTRTITSVASSSSATLEWDARGDAGAVVGAGVWTVEVSAVDLQGNVSDACSQTVQIRELYRSVE